MECFVFGHRAEWAEFTRRHMGSDAAIYLQIGRGGYTVRDRFVAFYLGDAATFSVAAHEGWHQFVARHFVGRLPPFLEEGIACMFEHPRWADGRPQWNLSINPSRAHGLRRAIEGRHLWPLEELITMHAGDVVGQTSHRIEAFYAQSWAFAKFLWEAEGGRYRPALHQLMSDAADGTIYDPTRSLKRSGRPWNRRGVRPMLEYYLGMPLDEIDAAYQDYIRRIAFDEFRQHWR